MKEEIERIRIRFQNRLNDFFIGEVDDKFALKLLKEVLPKGWKIECEFPGTIFPVTIADPSGKKYAINWDTDPEYGYRVEIEPPEDC
jgi:hypothetical protein